MPISAVSINLGTLSGDLIDMIGSLAMSPGPPLLLNLCGIPLTTNVLSSVVNFSFDDTLNFSGLYGTPKNGLGATSHF
jgi:uncharacterized membrane protein